MKKIILLTAFLVTSMTLVAQEAAQTSNIDVAKKHELSLDVLSGVGIPAFNPRYEYILGQYSGVGIEVFIGLIQRKMTLMNMKNYL